MPESSRTRAHTPESSRTRAHMLASRSTAVPFFLQGSNFRQRTACG